MAEQNTPEWVTDLVDELADLLSNNKVVKFSTHGNRKNFIAKVRSLVRDTIVEKTTPKTGRDALVITHPNPNPSQNYTVMTPSKSQQIDQAKEQRNTQQPSVRRW